jgi:hypothetical protein
MTSRAEKKIKKAAYKRALDVVGAVVRDWDPYGLIDGGAPADEFDSEIAAVITQIPPGAQVGQVAHEVTLPWW